MTKCAQVARLFSREGWGSPGELLQFAREARGVDDLNHLACSLVNLISRAVGVRWVVMLQRQTGERLLSPMVSLGEGSPRDLQVAAESGLLRKIADEDRPLGVQELQLFPQWDESAPLLQQRLTQCDARIFVPLKTRGELTGLLVLGPKVSGPAYSQGDIALLDMVAAQASTSMENACLRHELRIQQERVQEVQAQLVQSAKLASVGTLSAGVAHEINNPVFNILCRTEMLLSRADEHLKSGKAQEYVTVIGDMANRVSKVVQGMLAFSRQEEPFHGVDLSQLAVATLQLLQHDLHLANIQVVRDYAAELPPVNGVANRLQQAIRQILARLGKNGMPCNGPQRH